MLEYPQLADEFEDSTFLFTVSYIQIEQKTGGMSKHIVKKEWVTEIEKYRSYVNEYARVRLMSEGRKEEKLTELISKWRETLRTSKFCGYNDITKFYERYNEFEYLKKIKCRICTVCGSRTRSAKKLRLHEVSSSFRGNRAGS